MKKQIYYALLFGGITLAVTSCSNKNIAPEADKRISTQNIVDEHGVQRMQASQNEQIVTFQSKDYHISLTRRPDESMEQVRNEHGDVYVDNQITLRITQGNRQVLDKTFTKQSFASLVNAGFLKKSILEGMVFDKTTSAGLVFAVSVSYPQTDLYIPIALTVDAYGKISMVREELMEDIYQPEE